MYVNGLFNFLNKKIDNITSNNNEKNVYSILLRPPFENMSIYAKDPFPNPGISILTIFNGNNLGIREIINKFSNGIYEDHTPRIRSESELLMPYLSIKLKDDELRVSIKKYKKSIEHFLSEVYKNED